MLKPTDPGERRHRIRILQPVTGSDASGSNVTYSELLQTWAKIVPTRATDVVRNGQQVSQAYLVINVRYRKEIQPNMQVQWVNSQTTYLIQGIENIEERNQELNLMCLAFGPNQ